MYILIDAISNFTTPAETIAKTVVKFILGSPDTVMWYLGVTIFGLFVLGVVLKSKENINKWLWCVLFISIGFYELSVLWDSSQFNALYELKNEYLLLFSSERLFLFRLLYFFFGLLLGKIPKLIYKVCTAGMKIVGSLVLLAIVVLDMLSLEWCGMEFVDIILPFWYMILSANVIFFALKRADLKCSKVQYGKISSLMYFLHYLVIFALRVVEKILGFALISGAKFIIVTVIVVIISYQISERDGLYRKLMMQ